MVNRPKGPKPRHVPQRTCVACRQTGEKRELVRLVRTVTGEVEIDTTGKKAGRGAYLCRHRECWESALKKRGVEHALQTTMSAENRMALEEFCRTLAKEESSAGE